MKKLSTILITVLAVIILTGKVYAQQSIRVAQFNTENGLALQGYDPVAYFTQNKAIKGQKELSVAAEGITYYFATAEDKELFKKITKNMNHNMEVGALMQWVLQAIR